MIDLRRREREPYTKRKSVTILIIGVVGLALAFTSLSTAAILQSNGVDSKIYTPFGIAFFPICIIDVIFLIYHYPGITLYEFNKQMEKEDLEVLSNINTDIVAYCVRNKFTLLEGGYYYKRRFSWSKDYVNYYILKCESSDIKETLDNEFNKFDSYNFQKRNKCFILFIEKDNVDKDDIKLLVESSYIYHWKLSFE